MILRRDGEFGSEALGGVRKDSSRTQRGIYLITLVVQTLYERTE